MKIARIVRMSEAQDFEYLLAKELMSRGHEIEIVTADRVVENYFRQKNVKINNIGKKVAERIKSINLKDEKAYEGKYNTALDYVYLPIFYKYHIAYDDKYPPYGSKFKAHKNYLKKKAMAYLEEWDEYLSTSKPDLLFIGGGGGQMINMSGEVIARKSGIPSLHLAGSSAIPNAAYYDTTSMLNKWVRGKYLEREPTEEEKEKILSYLDYVKREKPLVGGTPKGTSILKKFRGYLTGLYRYIFFKQPYDPRPLKPLKHFLLHITRRRLAKRYYSAPDFSEKYVFFPLQVPHDAQMTIRAQQFVRQDVAVEDCARCMPEGYVLYVKEHPRGRGFYPLSWLKRMNSLPNVKIIPPEINPHDLIINSRAIITINSDVGWEALIHFKPAVILGEPFYSGFGVTFDVKDKKEICSKLKEAIKTNRVDEGKVLRLVNAVMNSTYTGSFLEVPEEGYRLENIKMIADAILDNYARIA